MSKEHNDTYSIIGISLLFADASNSLLTNTWECLLIELLYISKFFKWKAFTSSLRRLCHFEPVK